MRSKPIALRAARERKGHTGRTLSEQSGVSQARISELESASIPVRPNTAKALADALDVEIIDIAEIDEPAEVAS